MLSRTLRLGLLATVLALLLVPAPALANGSANDPHILSRPDTSAMLRGEVIPHLEMGLKQSLFLVKWKICQMTLEDQMALWRVPAHQGLIQPLHQPRPHHTCRQISEGLSNIKVAIIHPQI
jgi:hypothetical protein